ncbi:MAG: WecB/TagA/CpsF family glycosyltransferase [Ignavibacteriaceae bacterium]|nr:WecB/TagA/CpsF family glycosyltransferase [Ignavibacteriaceae bacterium]
MQKYFNIKFEFDRTTFKKAVVDSIIEKKKGYICVVDGNVLAQTLKNKQYNSIINNSIVNACDGSSISLLAGLIHNKQLQTYTGPEIFQDFSNLGFSQIFLGNTSMVLEKLKLKLSQNKIDFSENDFYSLPFNDVNDFDYQRIASDINKKKSQIIWVSLGAPKQEIFMSNLLPFLKRGVLFGIGAAINSYIADGTIKRAPLWLRELHLEWVFRVLKEPNRIGKRAFRYMLLIPKLVINELRQKGKLYETTS